MKISEKVALALAGYSKAEIEAMETPAQNPAPATVQNQIPAQITQPAQTDGQPDSMEAFFQQLLGAQQATTQALQTMTQTMQANAVGMGVQQQPAATADTITARIIDPTYGKEVK